MSKVVRTSSVCVVSLASFLFLVGAADALAELASDVSGQSEHDETDEDSQHDGGDLPLFALPEWLLSEVEGAAIEWLNWSVVAVDWVDELSVLGPVVLEVLHLSVGDVLHLLEHVPLHVLVAWWSRQGSLVLPELGVVERLEEVSNEESRSSRVVVKVSW